MNWEVEFLLFLQEHVRCGFLTVIMKLFTYMANYGILWIALCLTLLINKKTRKLGIICSVALVLNYMTCNVIIKSIVGRTRPFEAIEELTLDTSFPSGHTSSAFTLACAITCYLSRQRKWVGAILIFVASMIGISRMYLGVHYPTDVLVGMLLGIATGVVTYLALHNKIDDTYAQASG